MFIILCNKILIIMQYLLYVIKDNKNFYIFIYVYLFVFIYYKIQIFLYNFIENLCKNIGSTNGSHFIKE